MLGYQCVLIQTFANFTKVDYYGSWGTTENPNGGDFGNRNTISLKEALSDPMNRNKWIKAIEDEFKSLEKHGTFGDPMPLPKGRTALGNRLILTIKYDGNNQPIKHKARLVVQSFSQQQDVDYQETYAPVTQISTLLLLLSYASTHDWELHQFDVKTAYLNATLSEICTCVNLKVTKFLVKNTWCYLSGNLLMD